MIVIVVPKLPLAVGKEAIMGWTNAIVVAQILKNKKRQICNPNWLRCIFIKS
jgi:hypothetical protein